jgi:hypothetical protein
LDKSKQREFLLLHMNILAALSAEMAGGTTIEIGGKKLQKKV